MDEIARLPEELLSAALALTTPLDACRAAAVSRAFRAAADSDAVWSCFLPRDLPPLADGELDGPARPPSKKRGFLRLSGRPALLADGLRSVWLDRETGARCYMLSARSLNIAWDDHPWYTRWIPITGSSFSEANELLHVCWLEIRGKMDSKMLSQSSTYGAYIVFKVAPKACGLDSPIQKTSISLGASKSTRRVCIDGYDGDGEDRATGFHHPNVAWRPLRPNRRNRHEIPENVLLPQQRADGWMELEMGEFYNDQGEDGEICISLTETSPTLKSGLIVQGIEIRPKKQCWRAFGCKQID
ncbi:hypothetical protein ACP70R_049978 [Stipagrostis hirtigluma subsp. patula]